MWRQWSNIKGFSDGHLVSHLLLGFESHHTYFTIMYKRVFFRLVPGVVIRAAHVLSNLDRSRQPYYHEEDIKDGFPNMVKGKRITSKKLFRRRNGSIDFSSQSHEQQARNSAADDHENTTSSNNNNDSKHGFRTHFADDEDEDEDEDYIVFCYKEDGAIYIVKDGKSEPSNHIIDYFTTRSSWCLNRKEEEEVNYIAAAVSNQGMVNGVK
ncbi:hypothetical protein Dsin_000737 [Dipteronia sinensis]|uniref:Uncharacterized protein n=1 Tax=Dipteronia sinensis TaxID=43782 RepID=A0AAE0B314_9ROSI|nr:hypothetical protein Dsin_000737 [Dipteronia sinensis]